MPRQSNGLTVKQKKFVAGVASGLQLKKAAENAGYSHPGVAGCKLMKRPVVQKALAEILEEHGLNDAYIAGKVREFCEAVKQDNSGPSPDYPVQLRGMDILCRLKGLFKTDIRIEKKMTYEQKIELTGKIKENPELLDDIKRRMIELRKTQENVISGMQVKR